MRKTLVLLFVSSFLLCSCVDDGTEVIDESENTLSANEDLIDRDIISLKESDALKVSRNFWNNSSSVATRSASACGNLLTIRGRNGQPLMYVLNNGLNNGYTVVSATKKYAPIIAYTESGNFDESDEMTQLILNEYESIMEYNESLDPDSLRQAHAIEWDRFETPSKELMTRVVTPNSQQINALKAAARTNLQSQGYSVYDFSMALQLVPPSDNDPNRAQHFVNDICNHTYPAFDCMDVNLFATKTTHEEYGPLLQTRWHQRYPFGEIAPNHIAGCWTIAMAQVMKYYSWPSSYNWIYMANDYTDISASDYRTGALFLLLGDILTRADADYEYNPDRTGISNNNAIDALRSFNYTVNDYCYYGASDRTMVSMQIKNSRPVILTGENSIGDGGHAWVCDGYKCDKTQYAAMVLDEMGGYEFFQGFYNHYNEFLHMNMGYNSEPVWKYNDSVSFTGANYNSNRHYITVSPNR